LSADSYKSRRTGPWLVAVVPEIGLAEILEPDQALGRIVEVNLRRAHAILREELGDLDVVAVLLAIEVVLYQDERVLGARADAVEPAAGAALLDRRNLDFALFEPRKMQPRLL
jgi:hypothetical protein